MLLGTNLVCTTPTPFPPLTKVQSNEAFPQETASLTTAVPDDTGACLLAISSWDKECTEEEEEEKEEQQEEEKE